MRKSEKSTKDAAANAAAWGLPRVLGFFATHRATREQLYPSEWFFVKDCLKEGMSVLDIGCAQGGFASVLAEQLSSFSYTGVDVNAEMIARARARHPRHRFFQVHEGDYSLLGNETFDLVLALGILHLHETWRDTIAAAWKHTSGTLILDLRETDGLTIEDKTTSFFRMDFNGGDASHTAACLPYIVVNSAEALATVRGLCPGARRLARYGYLHPTSPAATCPIEEVMATAYRIDR